MTPRYYLLNFGMDIDQNFASISQKPLNFATNQPNHLNSQNLTTPLSKLPIVPEITSQSAFLAD